MSAPIDIDELIARPLDVISQLRVDLKERTESSSGDPKGCLAAVISDALCSGDSPALEKVPVLSRECLIEGKLPPNTLVRYRGMVQDQYEPEYFVGSFEEVHTATGQRARVDVSYMDSIPQRTGFVNEYEGPGAKTMERLPVFCVPVPGLSPWAQPPTEESKGHENGSCQQGASVGGQPKRPREAEDAMDCTDGNTGTTPGEQPEAAVSSPNAKAQRATGNGAEANEEASTDGGEKSALAGAFHHKQELELEGLACVVKLYDYKEGDLKLNDNAEFVGVLGYDQALPSQEDGQVGSGDPFQGLSEFSRKIPPPSLAPRLHSIFYRSMAACAPLSVDPGQPKDALHALQGPLPFGAFMLDTKRQAIAHLASAIGGDALAAELALLTILSRAYVRTESSAPGSLSLNLRGLSADDVPRFHAAVADMVPKCVTVPVTTKSLSEEFTFSPKKDYDADRLMLSYLQLSEGTVVLLDETRLETGQIGAEGVNSISTLKSLLSVQKIPYDFGFYKMDFDVDHPTISLSSRGSVVPTGAVVPVVASGETPAVSDAATLSRLRVYVEATRRLQLSLDEFSSSFAEEDFVKARQDGHALTGDDFHRMLTIARLTALSLGDGIMNASHWNHMKDIEARVAGRAQISGAERASQPAGAMPESPSQAAASLNVIPEDD